MEPLQRITPATLDVLDALMTSSEDVWGLLIIKQTGRPAGTVYPILERLEQRQWVESSWEDDPTRPGPRRRTYSFTAEGRAAAEQLHADRPRQQATRRRTVGRPALS